MDEKNQKPKEDVEIGIPVVPLVLGGMLATGPINGAGILPFMEGNIFADKVGEESVEKDEEEDKLRR